MENPPSLEDVLNYCPGRSFPKINLSENARAIFDKRYSRRNELGQPTETPEDAIRRIAYEIAKGEETEQQVKQAFFLFYDLLADILFFPNTPTWTGAGTPLGQLAACFVLPISDDLGREYDGIMSTLRNASLIQQTGGGNGFSFSNLRQEGAFIRTSAGRSTGPIGFLKVFDTAFGMIAQGGTRRGANMAVLRVDHPDIRKFISCKASETSITNFNISVGITDKFMRAVKENATYDLIAPHTKEVIETVPARDIFNLIVEYAHKNGEPGILFLDTANAANPVPHLYELTSTNPCGEQWLGPYENCCLGSINLSNLVNPITLRVDWEKLSYVIALATRFLDDVVTVNKYVDHVPELKEAAFKTRRIGLGIMGLADMMLKCGIAYGSKEGEEFASQIMEFIRYESMCMSRRLAVTRGAFPAIQGSIFDSTNFRWKPPVPLEGVVHSTDFGRPTIDWDDLVEKIKKDGIRNAVITTVAPTGTIATVAGCMGYGCEPLFALAYLRHVNDNGKDLVLKTVVNELFEKALIDAKYSEEEISSIISEVAFTGSCQNVKGLSESIKKVFVVSGDLTPEQHVRMQASLQAFVDNSMSKTCNLPRGATHYDVEQCYMKAWELGCKGITVYVAGSRDVVVIETEEEVQRKLEKSKLKRESLIDSPQRRPVKKKERPQQLVGITDASVTPLGKLYVTLNRENGVPFEIFITCAKAGSETAAVAEAFGRLLSYILRMDSPVPEEDRLKHIYDQLKDIGGKRSRGYGAKKVGSLPDGIARALRRMLDENNLSIHSLETIRSDEESLQHLEPASKSRKNDIGEICPQCGFPCFIESEGCKTCYSCAYTEC